MEILHILTTVPALITIYLMGAMLTWSLGLGLVDPKGGSGLAQFGSAFWPIGLPITLCCIVCVFIDYHTGGRDNSCLFRKGWIHYFLEKRIEEIKEAKSKPVPDTLEQTFTELEKIK